MKDRIIKSASLLLLCALLSACGAEVPAEEAAFSGPETFALPHSAAEEAEPDDAAEEESETFVPIAFSVDRHRLSRDAWEYLGSAVSDYEALLDAVFKKQASVKLPDADAAGKAVAVFEDSLYGAVADVQYSGDTASIFYDGDADPQKAESALKALMEGALAQDMNTLEKVLSLYRAVATELAYEDSPENSLYRAMTEHVGSSTEFAGVFQCALNQLGIDAQIASGQTEDGIHYWVTAAVDGKTYHFDPTFEHSTTGGAGLGYFGMSDEMRAYTGCDAPYTLGLRSYAKTVDTLCEDERFDRVFLEVTDWELLLSDHTLRLAYGFSDSFSATFQTE